MTKQIVEQKFDRMGARVKFGDRGRLRFSKDQTISIDISRDEEGEFFDIRTDGKLDFQVLDVKKKDRHLLLMTKDAFRKQKFLCGHDERHWFTAAIPEKSGASTVFEAMQALKSPVLVEAEKGLKRKDSHKRHRKADIGKIHRQGEFTFVPDSAFEPGVSSLSPVLKNEPMQRGGGSKPHMAEFLFRQGGRQVYISRKHPNGISEKQYKSLMKNNEEARQMRWETRVVNPRVYVKGRITHADHATLNLKDVWHRVILNTEDQAWASRNVAFMD